jgi:hypothetical protein
MLDSPVNVTSHSQEDIVEYVEELKENSKRIHDKINENLSKAHNVQKKYYDQAIRDTRKYQIGDLVSVVNERSIVGQSHAFKDRVIGPYKIIKKFNGDLNYQIVGLNNKKINSIHYNRLLPYRARNDKEFNFDQVVNQSPSRAELVELHPNQNYFNFEVDDDLIMSLNVIPVVATRAPVVFSCDL